MKHMLRRRFLQLAGGGTVAATPGGLAATLASGRANPGSGSRRVSQMGG